MTEGIAANFSSSPTEKGRTNSACRPQGPDMLSELDAIVAAHRDMFCDIVREYLQRTNGEADNMRLKREHSLRVLDNARILVHDLDLCEDDARTVLLAALYHDLGRFPQLEEYGTLNDAESEDHGKISVRALLRRGLLDDLVKEARRAVVGAVFLHNKRCVPSGLPGLMDTALRVVRDSDKLDIFRVMIDNLNEAACRDNPTVVLGLKYDGTAYTSGIAEAVGRGELADYRSMRWINDFKLLLLAWVYDLNFTASRRLLAQRGMARTVADMLPATRELDRIKKKVLADLQSSLQDGSDA